MACPGGTLLVLLLVASLNLTLGRTPGIQMRLTSKGINYAEEVTQRLLRENIKSLDIEDQSGKDDGLTWSLSKVVSSVTGLDVDISLNPAVGGTSLSVSNINIKVKAEWDAEYKYQFFGPILARGSLEADITQAAVTIQVNLNEIDGRLTFDVRHCDAKIGDINLKFSAGRGDLLESDPLQSKSKNLFRTSVSLRVRSILEDKTCEFVKREAQKVIENHISKLPVTVNVLRGNFMLDYSLVDRPKVGSNYVELHHKGSFYYKGDNEESPLQPSPIFGFNFNRDEKMISIVVTEYVSNTFCHAAQKNDFLQYSFDLDELGRDERERFLLDDTRVQIENAFPGSKLKFNLKSSSPPKIKFSTDIVKVDGDATLQLVSESPFESSIRLALDAKVSVKIKPSIQNNAMVMTFSDLEIELSASRTGLSSLLVRYLKPLLNGVVELILLPKLNELGSEGVALPTGNSVQLVDPKLILTPGVLKVSSDIHYK